MNLILLILCFFFFFLLPDLYVFTYSELINSQFFACNLKFIFTLTDDFILREREKIDMEYFLTIIVAVAGNTF